MDERVHCDTTCRLDLIKANGLIVDYWASWVGSSGDLRPKLSSWINCGNDAELIRGKLALALRGFVASENITVKVDEFCGNA
jgi:hypothetical protein